MVYRAKRALFSVLGIRSYNYKGEGGGGGSTPNHPSRSLSFVTLSSDDHQV